MDSGHRRSAWSRLEEVFDFSTSLLPRGRGSDQPCVNAAVNEIARYAAGAAVFSPFKNRVGHRARMQRYKQMAGRVGSPKTQRRGQDRAVSPAGPLTS